MDSSPLFSLIALVREEKKHLLESTLDSLISQQERRFEVIVIDGTGQKRVKDQLKTYDFSLRIYPAEVSSGAEMMNEAIRLATGKYIQFLAPGDRYISQEGLSYLSQLIQNGPHLIYSGFLIHGSETVLFPLDRRTLEMGVFSRDCWFLRKAVIEFGGFDAKLTHRSGFELLCRFYLTRGVQTSCCRRVLTEGGGGAPPVIRYAFETYRILYRHFGLISAIRWMFIQNHLQLFRWFVSHFRQAFWKEGP